MAVGGFVCPWCGAYNAFEERRCHRCEQLLPPPGISRLLRTSLGEGLWATKILGGLSVVIFALEMATSGKEIPLFKSVHVSSLLRFGALLGGMELEQPYRFLSACFVHMSILHIGMNMFALASLGRLAEGFVGGTRLIVTYVVTGIVGFVVSMLWGAYPLTAGASGAVFGVDGLVIAAFALRRDPQWKNALIQGVIYIVLTSFSGLPINNAAHVGGLVCGIALGIVFGLEKRSWRIGTLVNVVAGLCIVAIAVSLVLPQRDPLWREVRAQENARLQ